MPEFLRHDEKLLLHCIGELPVCDTEIFEKKTENIDENKK